MKKFCPTCDAVVEIADPATLRCPQCLKAVIDAPAIDDPNPQRKSSRTLLLATFALLLIAVVAGWQWQRAQKAVAPSAAKLDAQPAAQDVATVLKSTDLKGDRAVAPGTADDAMAKYAIAAPSTAALVAQIAALRKPGGLQQVSLSTRRKHPVLNTAQLFKSVTLGLAQPVHPVEAAWMLWALLQARGEHPTFVTESAGVQTPLMLSRTRLGLKLSDGTVIEPLQATPMQAAKPVSDLQAAAWWLVVRANVLRLNGDFKLVYEDLAAAQRLVPGLATAEFVRGVAQLDQKMDEPGVAACEAALQKADDPLARLFLAEVAMGAEQPVKAVQRCDEVLKLHPAMPEALVTKAMILLQRLPTLPVDQRDKAAAEVGLMLDDALKANPAPQGARAAKAQWFVTKGDMPNAEELLKVGVTEFKELESALMLAELYNSKQQFAEAAAVFGKINAPLEDERVVTTWVSALVNDKQPEKAAQIVEQAHALAPTSTAIGLMRAQLLAEAGKLKESIAALEPFKDGQESQQIIGLQAQLLLQDKQPEKAIALVTAVLAKNPTDKKLLLLQIVAMARANQLDAAQKVADKAIADKIALPMEVVEVWLQGQQMPRAQKLLEQEVAADKPDPKAAATLAVVYVMQDQKPLALQLRAKMVKLLGEHGQEFATIIDEAIAAAEAEKGKRATDGAAAVPPK